MQLIEEIHDISLPANNNKERLDKKLSTKKIIREPYLDLLRIVSMVGVITIHVTCDLIFQNYSTTIWPIWWASSMLNGLSHFAVPVFVMISGALLLGDRRPESLPAFYARRLPKIVIPLIAWSIIYQVFRAIILKKNLSIIVMMQKFCAGNTEVHLWYLFMILYLYLATPFLKIIVNNISGQALGFYVFMCVIINSILPLVSTFTIFKFSIYSSIFADFTGYFLMGYLIHKHFTRDKKILFVVGGLSFAVGGAIITFGTYYLFQMKKTLDPLLYQYSTIGVFILSFGAFTFVKGMDDVLKNRYIAPVLAKIGSISYGVYLTHYLIYYLLIYKYNNNLSSFQAHPYLSMGARIAVVTAASICLTIILRCIKFVRVIVP